MTEQEFLKIKKHILSLLKKKDPTDEKKEKKVITFINSCLRSSEDQIMIDKIIEYIIRCKSREEIYQTLTKSQVINMAYDYILFLSNDHENTDYLTR